MNLKSNTRISIYNKMEINMDLDIENMTKVQLVTKIIKIEPEYKNVISRLYTKTNKQLQKLLLRLIKEKHL